jgi:hypothetical protein
MVVVKFAVPPAQMVDAPETANTDELAQHEDKAAFDTTSISAADKARL